MSIHPSTLKEYLQKITAFSPIVLLTTLLVVSFLFCKFAFGWYPAKYSESAHGNYANRSAISSLGYAVGHCAHCHEQHASIGGAEPAPTGGPDKFLFFDANIPRSQINNFCFWCHGPSSVQVSGVTNNDYGSEFGGGAANSTTIKDAFDYGPPNRAANGTTGSSHNLKDIQDWSQNQTWGNWITNNTNACVVCHDPHYSQKNHDPYPASPPYKTAIRLPSHPSSSEGKPRNLWGDEANSDAGNEIVSEQTGYYQAPYYGTGPHNPATGPFEPAGDATQDGSNLPNFKTFCTTCHILPISPSESDPYFLEDRSLNKPRWTSSQHGSAHMPNSGQRGSLKDPYNIETRNYRLACTDCHEPHGSPTNPFLLRTCVNGKDNITVSIAPVASPVAADWNNLNFYDFCTACHIVNTGPGSADHEFTGDAWIDEDPTTVNCMMNGACHEHGSKM